MPSRKSSENEEDEPSKMKKFKISSDSKSKKKQSKEKDVLVLINMLDGTVVKFRIQKTAKGSELIDRVCDEVDLAEKDYFGLIYVDGAKTRHWLARDKKIGKQMKTSEYPWEFNFGVRYYPPDPAQLFEDITRYQLCFQVRNDILSGKLPCSFDTYALLGSYLVQSEFGDFDPAYGDGSAYVRELRLAPKQTPQLEDKVSELHKTHTGQTPEQAELHYLENAKKLALYGVELHPATDFAGVNILLGVCANGLLVYRDKLRIYRFAWPRIVKIAYRRNALYLKILTEESSGKQREESTFGFKLADNSTAERLWRDCVEHHSFFRLQASVPPQRYAAGLIPGIPNKIRVSNRSQYGKHGDGSLERTGSQRPVKRSTSIMRTAPPPPTSSPLMREVPAEGELEIDAGKSEEAIKIWKQMEEKRIQLEQEDAFDSQASKGLLPPPPPENTKKIKKVLDLESEPAEFLLQPNNGARPKIVPVKEPVLGASNNSDASVSKLPEEAVALERLNGMDRMKNKMDEVFAQNNGFQNKSQRPYTSSTSSYDSNGEQTLLEGTVQPGIKLVAQSQVSAGNHPSAGKRESGDWVTPLKPNVSPTSTANVQGNNGPLGAPVKGVVLSTFSPGSQRTSQQQYPMNSGKKPLNSTTSDSSIALSPVSSIGSEAEYASNEFYWNNPNSVKPNYYRRESSISSISEVDESGLEEKDRKVTETDEEFPPPPPMSPYDGDVSSIGSPENNRRLTETLVQPEKAQKAELVFIPTDTEDDDQVFDESTSSSSTSAETVQAREDVKPIVPLDERRVGGQQKQPPSPPVSPTSTSLRRPQWKDNDVKKRMSDARNSFLEAELQKQNDSAAPTVAKPEANLGPKTVGNTTEQGQPKQRPIVPPKTVSAYKTTTGQGQPPQRPTVPPPYRDPPPPPVYLATKSAVKMPEREVAVFPAVIQPSVSQPNVATQPPSELDVLVKTTRQRIGSGEDSSVPMIRGPLGSNLYPYVRPYTYHSTEDPKRPFEPQVMGFKYFGNDAPFGSPPPRDPIDQTGLGEEKIGLAFNYAPRKVGQVPDARSSFLKNVSFVPSVNEKPVHATAEKVEIQPVNMDYVESATLKDNNKSTGLAPPLKTSGGTANSTAPIQSSPKIVKTTTKQTVVQNADGVKHNKQEKVEDLTAGGTGSVSVFSSTNQTDLPELASIGNIPHLKATQVTTRTALTKEDKDNTTSQIEEKTFTATTMTTPSGLRQEKVVTQEVMRTATILKSSEPTLVTARPVSVISIDSDDSGTNVDDDQETPIVKTAPFKYDPSRIAPSTSSSSPFVPTETRKVGGATTIGDPSGEGNNGASVTTALTDQGEVVSTSTVSSKSRTVETVTYKKEHDGVVETRVQQKITVQTDGDPIDHDQVLAEAIQEATATNPDMTVEKIEIHQHPLPQAQDGGKFQF